MASLDRELPRIPVEENPLPPPPPHLQSAQPAVSQLKPPTIDHDVSELSASNLERKDSVSSVSSAASTSSIEAVPFRARPRGNLHLHRAVGTPSPWLHETPIPVSPTWSADTAEDVSTTTVTVQLAWQLDTQPAAPLPDVLARRTPTPNSSMLSPHASPVLPPKLRHVPKQPTDRWMYRNGPGQTRRLPMLGPVTQDDRFHTRTPSSMSEDPTYRPSSRPPSFYSYTSKDNASIRSLGSDHKTRTPELRATKPGDEDARSTSSITTLAPPSMLDAPPWTTPPSQEITSQTRTMHWLAEQQQQQSAPADRHLEAEMADMHLRQEMPNTLPGQQSIRSSVSTIVAPSSSPYIPPISVTSTPSPTLNRPASTSMEEKRLSHNTFSSGGQSETGKKKRRVVTDFVFGEVLGEGSYSTVLKAWDVYDLPLEERQALTHASNALAAAAGQVADVPFSHTRPKAYAVKVLDKVHILKEKKQKYVRVEKEALTLLSNTPGVVTLYHTFQDRESLYFVLELAPNNELLHYIRHYGSLDLQSATFYAAQLADVIAKIHEAGVIHRDIKPENVLLDAHMRILLTDFGSARVLTRPTSDSSIGMPSTQHSFVGTADYVSPELLNDLPVGKPADWWAFGCVLFKMLAGQTPFHATNEYQTFQRILHRSFIFPEGFTADARTLMEGLLCMDPNRRMAAQEVYIHPFFQHVDFPALWTATPPPMHPGLVQRVRPPTVNEMDLGALAAAFDDPHEEDSTGSYDPSSATGDEGDASSAASHSLSGANLSSSPSVSSQSHIPTPILSWTNILLPGEDMVFSSPMLLRRSASTGMFSRKCQMILTSLPRLLCIRENNNACKVLANIPLKPRESTAMKSRTATTAEMESAARSLSQSDSRRGTAPRRTLSIRSQASMSSLKRRGTLSRTLSILGRSDPDRLDTASMSDRSGKDEIIEAGPIEVELRSPRVFVVQAPSKQWQFEDPSGDALFWVQNIRDAMEARSVSQS